MNNVRIVVVEDEFAIAEDIKSLLTDSGYLVIGVFDHAEEALPFIIENLPDIILIDIRLAGKMTGIELVENVKINVSLPVIYLTANSEKATYNKARATKPNAFLVKPFTPANLLASIDLAIFNFSNDSSPDSIERNEPSKDQYEAIIHRSLFIKCNGRHTKLNADDILFVEGAGSYVHIQTTSDRFTLTQNLSKFLRKTPLENIIRIHRSYLININKIDSFEESGVYISNHKLPIGDTYKEEFLSRIHTL